MDETTSLITVTQLPIIEERLREFKDQVEALVKEAKSMVATADTIQAVKNRRAELNKQFTLLEDQRKAVKAEIMAPYERFNATYKECIENPFRTADAALKATVDEFEGEMKKAALLKLETYYAELCAMEGIDWLPFEDAMRYGGIKISMADTKTKMPRKAMDALGNFVAKVALGVDAVRKMDDSAEVMVEYKKCLDAGRAAATVQERKRKVEEAKAESEKHKEWEAKRAEAMAKVMAAVPVTVMPTQVAAPDLEQIWPEFTFTVYNCTRTQLIKVREFLKQEGISYA